MPKEQMKRGLVLGLAVMVALVGAIAVAGCQGAEGEEEQAQPEQTIADRRIEALSAELELTDDQTQRLRNVRDIVHERRDAFRAERGEFVETRLDELEAGELDSDAIHQHIDEKIEEIRTTAHRVADELIELASTMDDAQRSRVAAKLRTFHERMERFHERMESGGPAAIMDHVREHVCSGDGEGFMPGMWFMDEESDAQ